jgi:hypothetical protein
MDEGPLLMVPVQGRFAVFFEGVIFPFAPVLTFAPAGFDQLALFHPVQYRVKHAVGPGDFVLGKTFDFLDEGVPVTFAPGQQGKNQRFGGRRHKFLVDHETNIHCRAMYVNKKPWCDARVERLILPGLMLVKTETGKIFWTKGKVRNNVNFMEKIAPHGAVGQYF